ncbi:MAG: helix-turn-helix domain-containing protein [Chthoniobacterales bacterium]
MKAKTNRKLFRRGIPDTYKGLCAVLPPRPIHDEVAYRNTLEAIDAMAGLPLNQDQEDYLAILSQQVYDYEQRTIPPADRLSGLEMLTTACQETGTDQTRLAAVLGVSESLVSLIFKGARPITQEHARKLGQHFGIRPELFLDLD